jgi:purine-nucleoside phosphorylase
VKKQKNYTKNIDESLRTIRAHVTAQPSIGVILGSGLGDFADTLQKVQSIETKDIPHYPRSTVIGHQGKLVFGSLERVPLLVFQGRVHFYETGTLETILYPIRIAHALGVKTLLVTNAAGGVNKKFRPGDLMLLEDQINLTFEKPGKGLRFGFWDLSFYDEPRKKSPSGKFAVNKPQFEIYDTSLQALILRTAKLTRTPLKSGVYMGVKGPSYETAAEIRMARDLGADAVGMSTVNEVSLAVGLGMRVAGISCITNLATGISQEKLSHAEVTEVANMAKKDFTALLQRVVKTINT